MKPRERFLMAVRHQEPDRVPQLIRLGRWVAERLSPIFGFSREEQGEYMGEDLGPRIGNDAVVCQIGINATMETSVGNVAEGETFTNEWGIVFKRLGGHNKPVKRPLAKKEDLHSYRWPDPKDPKKFVQIDRVMKKYHDDYAVIVDLSSSLLEASYIHLARGSMEEFFFELYDDPAWVGKVLDGLADYYSALGTNAILRGVDVIRIGDDIGGQNNLLISPSMWRELVKPRLVRMIQAFKKTNPGIIILYHSCGDFSLVFDDLIEAGVEFISTMQPTGALADYAAVKKRYGDRLAFKGGLCTQQLLPNGTPSRVREEVKKLIGSYAPGGGYVFMPAHMVYEDVPTENIWAMIEALRDYGKYPLQV